MRKTALLDYYLYSSPILSTDHDDCLQAMVELSARVAEKVVEVYPHLNPEVAQAVWEAGADAFLTLLDEGEEEIEEEDDDTRR